MTKIDETALEAAAKTHNLGYAERAMFRMVLETYLAAAHPWRPLTQAPRDGRTIELRVPGQAGRQFARVYETDGVIPVARMLECHFGFGKVSSGPTFAQLCADGAEVRELMP